MAGLSVNDKTTIYGDRLELTFKGKPLAFGKSCSLEISADTLDTSNKMSADWMEYLVGKLSFTLSSNTLLTYSDSSAEGEPELAKVAKFGDLLATMVERNPIDFAMSRIKKDDTSGDYKSEFDFVTGKAVITQLSISADDGQIATCSVNLQGTGALTIGSKFKGTVIGEATE